MAQWMFLVIALTVCSELCTSPTISEVLEVQPLVGCVRAEPDDSGFLASRWHELLTRFYAVDNRVGYVGCKEGSHCSCSTRRRRLIDAFRHGPWTRGCCIAQKLVGLHGSELVDEIERCKKKPLDELLPDVYALIWYLYALAVKKDRPFNEGSFIIIGKGSHALFRYLVTVSHLIGGEQRRVSTHLNDIAGEHHAIDVPCAFRGKKDWLLPHDSYTILFRNLDHGRLFIKPEPNGTHTRTDRFHHSFGLLKSLWHNNVGAHDRHGCAKERVPIAVKKALRKFLSFALRDDCHVGLFGGLIESCYNFIIGNTKAARIKGFLKELERKGIKHISFIVQRVTEQYLADHNCLVLEGDALHALHELESCLSWYDYCSLREGNEVIIPYDEIMAGL